MKIYSFPQFWKISNGNSISYKLSLFAHWLNWADRENDLFLPGGCSWWLHSNGPDEVWIGFWSDAIFDQPAPLSPITAITDIRGGGQWRQDLVIDLNVTISSLLCPYWPSKLGDFCGSFNLVDKGFINTLVSFWCEIQLFWCVNCCPNLFVFCFMFVLFFMFVCLFVIYLGQFQLFRCVHCCPNLFVCLLFEANFNSFGVSTANCSP